MSKQSPAKHIRILRRRADWLRERVATTTKNSFDKAEIAALEWAVNQLDRIRLEKTNGEA